MRRYLIIALGLALLAGVVPAALAAPSPGPVGAIDHLSAAASGRTVEVSWSTPRFPAGAADEAVVVERDGQVVARMAPTEPYVDERVQPGERHRYAVHAEATTGKKAQAWPRASAAVQLPAYAVGAATADITPTGLTNLGGFGLGDGSLFPDAVVGRGGQAKPQGEHIRARAMVVDDGRAAVAIAVIETQGMFAAYQNGPWGLLDMANRVAKNIPALPADHIIIATDHTHSGPDTIGAWGGVPDSYIKFISDQMASAIEQAFNGRQFANVWEGSSDASDLIYNQACTEALNQSPTPDYPGPSLCATPGKDGFMRVVQARTPAGKPVVTYVAYAAHATAGGGNGIHGDWPQFLSDAMAAEYGGVGMSMEGANGGTQPCRPTCAFTNPSNPGTKIKDRKPAILANYMAHVHDALAHATVVEGPVGGDQQFIREPITGAAVLALFTAGKYAGAGLLRSHQSPWVVGTTIRTVVSDVRVGRLLFAGTPGEGFYAIGAGIRRAVGDGMDVIQLGLANDQLGYLIAPASYVPVIAAEVAVNDNIIFNVSPTIGDHVMCAGIALAGNLGLDARSPATCAPYNAADAAGDPLGAVPVGGIVAG
ncbi:MAG TPA: hypothetical protein VFA83_23180 [Acidimicrobiales bacterium]|nr:hypothetical protein [Acidimicrobiales bacterium]